MDVFIDSHRVTARVACGGQAVFTLVTRGHVLTPASKFNIEPNGGMFDVSTENDHTSPNVKTP